MGANAVTTMAEAVAPFLEELTGGPRGAAHPLQSGRPPSARARAVFQEGGPWAEKKSWTK
jgi:hydroxymethylglutaryl-CoA reductase